MGVFVYLMGIIFLAAVSCWTVMFHTNALQRKICNFISLSVILLIVLLRRDDVGGDLVNYRSSFYYWSGLNFVELLKIHNSDIGFMALNWIVGQFSDNFYAFIRICGGLTILILYKAIKKMAVNIPFCLFSYISIFGYAKLCSSLRSELAAAIVFLAVAYMHEKRYQKGFFLLVLASIIHSTALIALLYVLIVFVKKRDDFRLEIAGVAVLFAAISWKGIPMLVKLYQINDYSQVIVRGEGVRLFLLVGIMLCMIRCLLVRRRYHANDIEMLAFKSCVFGEAVQVLAFGFSLLNRLTEYFWIFFIILLPNTVCREKGVQKRVIAAVSIAMLFVFANFLLISDSSGILPYHFFFEL